jgi:hypothetical protein
VQVKAETVSVQNGNREQQCDEENVSGTEHGACACRGV